MAVCTPYETAKTCVVDRIREEHRLFRYSRKRQSQKTGSYTVTASLTCFQWLLRHIISPPHKTGKVNALPRSTICKFYRQVVWLDRERNFKLESAILSIAGTKRKPYAIILFHACRGLSKKWGPTSCVAAVMRQSEFEESHNNGVSAGEGWETNCWQTEAPTTL